MSQNLLQRVCDMTTWDDNQVSTLKFYIYVLSGLQILRNIERHSIISAVSRDDKFHLATIGSLISKGSLSTGPEEKNKKCGFN